MHRSPAILFLLCALTSVVAAQELPHEAAITPEQVKELVADAKRYHVTVMPEQEPFGHLHHVLKYELYQDIAETPQGHVITPTISSGKLPA